MQHIARRLAAGAITMLIAGLALVAPAGANPMPVPAATAAPPVMSPTLWVWAHIDDETLAASVAIAEHAYAGQDIHILWLSRGTASSAINAINGATISSWWGVRHDPAAEGYQPLTPAELGDARVREGTTAVRSLTAGLSGTLTTHVMDLPDGGITQAAAVAAIRQVSDQIAPGGGSVRIKTHSHLVDDHADHRAIGNAAKQLKADPSGRWSDVRHYVLPMYWSDARLSQVAWSWDTPAAAGDIAQRTRNAVRSYCAWAPPERLAIGCHSVAGPLDQLAAAPKSLVHT